MHIQPIQPDLLKRTIQLALCLLIMAFFAQHAFSQANYYYDPPGSITTPGNWWTMPGGTGTQLTSFQSFNPITFHILDNATLDNNWDVQVIGGQVKVGNGSSNVTFTIPENFAFNGFGTVSIDVANNATLIITNHNVPILDTLHDNSTVIYNENVADAGNQVIAQATYGNLTINNDSPGKTLSGTITVDGQLTFNNTNISVPSAATLNLNGNLVVSGTVIFNTNVKSNLTITHTGNTTQTITASSTIPCLNFISNKTGGSLTLATSPATSLDIGNNFTINYSAGATFNDNGNTVTVGGTFSLGNDGDLNFPGGTYQNVSLDFTEGNNAILQGDATINGFLDMNGSGNIANINLVLGDNDLTINSEGVITGFSAINYIVTNSGGELFLNAPGGQQTFFPIGTSGTYNRLRIDNNGSDAVISARVFSGVFTSGTSGGLVAQIAELVNRTWSINSASSPVDVNAQFQWTSGSHGVDFNPANGVKIFQFSGGQWNEITTPATPTGLPSGPFTIESGTITSFSEFTLGDDGASLPVTWLSFTGQEVHPGIASLEWKTASELNNQGFEVQKSLDGKNFEVLGFVEGAGTTNEIQTYGFSDEHLRQNTYYRLKQIDFDGQFDYSRIIFVESSQHVAHPFTLYPNPVDNSTPVRLVYQLAEADKKQPLQLQLHDMRGSLLLTVNGNIDELNEVLNARISGMSQGVYLLTLTDFATLTHLKVLKQ